MKSFLIIGIGSFGRSVATSLYDMGHDVLVVDRNEEAVAGIADLVTHAVVGNAIDSETLKSIGAADFHVAIVAMSEDIQASILITLLLKELGVGFIVAKAQNNLHAKVLEKVGADRVIFPEHDMGVRVANNLGMSNILDYLEISSDHSIVEIPTPNAWVNMSLAQLDVRGKHGVNIIAIKTVDSININPNPDDVLTKEDILVMMGGNDDVDNVARIR